MGIMFHIWSKVNPDPIFKFQTLFTNTKICFIALQENYYMCFLVLKLKTDALLKTC